jgi:hypothetical protein
LEDAMRPVRVTLTAIAALFILLTIGARSRAAALRPNEEQKIEALISTVEKLQDATFIRNGTEYDCKAAADHMRSKWKWKRDEIKTARDFIRVVASVSSESGQPYLIRFKNGKEVKAADFFTAELDKLERP